MRCPFCVVSCGNLTITQDDSFVFLFIRLCNTSIVILHTAQNNSSKRLCFFQDFWYTYKQPARPQWPQIGASSSVGQSWRLITARPRHFSTSLISFLRCFCATSFVKTRFHLLFTYEAHFEKSQNNVIRAISLTVKAGGS